MKKYVVLIPLLTGFVASSTAIAKELVDKVVAIVDKGVVLESQVEGILNDVKRKSLESGQTLPPDRVLRTQAVDRLISQEVQLNFAERIGLKITDMQLDQAIQRIAGNQNKNVEQFRLSLVSKGVNYAQYREKLREEITISQLQQIQLRRRVYVSPQEIESLLRLMEKQKGNSEEFRIGHILVALPEEVSDKEVKATEDKANKILKYLEEGKDFKKLAITSSSGSKALEGGDWGWMNINEMPTLFAEQVRDKTKGKIIGPLRSGAGFHILKIFDIRGRQTVEVEEVHSRHILIKPSIILSEKKAQSLLGEFREKLQKDPTQWLTLAKEYSEDPGSKSKGGDLGWSSPSVYVPAFKEQLAQLNTGEYSQPFRSMHGWHLVQLMERRKVDATADHKRERAYQLLFNRKYSEELASWQKELKDRAYIEIIGQ